MTDERIRRICERLVELNEKDPRLQLIMTRFCIRYNLDRYNQIDAELQCWRRQKRKLEAQMEGGRVKFPLLESRIEKLEELRNIHREGLAAMGEMTIALVDIWQEQGANFDSLCDLCGSPRNVLEKRLYKESPEGQLSEILCAAGLDYYDNGSGWYEYTQDGPFAHATREYLIAQMLHTKTGRAAAHRAMEEVFPDLMDKALYLREDAFGEQCLYDKDGNLVAEGVAFEDD